MSKKNKKLNLKILPDSTVMSIALIAVGFAEVLFLMFVLALDVLPFKYIVAVILLMLLVDLFIYIMAHSEKGRKTKSIAALVVIVFMMNVLLMGDYYVYSTYDTLQKVSKQRDSWEYYNVVTLKEGSYMDVDDITGQVVNVVEMDSKQLNEARERLITRVDVTYEEFSDVLALGETLVDKEGKTHDEITLMSTSQLKVIKNNNKNFGKNTQIIYKIKVKKRVDDSAKRVDVTKDSFNVLISGMDVWGTIDQDALSDVNMVMTVNPVTKQVLLTSIPRDSYIPLHTYGANDKLTHSGLYGDEETKATIEDFLDIDINYVIKVNFSMLCNIVDAVGGINVYNDTDFYSSVKGWHYTKGWHHMNGHYALWFARERKSFLEGDMKRNENQQKVLYSLIKKVTRSKVILTRYTSILNAVEDQMKTDLTDKDLKKLAKMQLNDMSDWDIERINIKGATGGAPCFSMGGQNLSCVFPNSETVEEAKKAIHDTMYPAELNKK